MNTLYTRLSLALLAIVIVTGGALFTVNLLGTRNYYEEITQRLNASIADASTRQGSLACDASSAERSQVIFGALFDADGATVAIFTDGNDPARARTLRNHIGTLLNTTASEPPQDQAPSA